MRKHMRASIGTRLGATAKESAAESKTASKPTSQEELAAGERNRNRTG